MIIILCCGLWPGFDGSNFKEGQGPVTTLVRTPYLRFQDLIVYIQSDLDSYYFSPCVD